MRVSFAPLTVLAVSVLRATTAKEVVSFSFGKNVHPGEAVGGFSDIDMTWLFHCAVAATGWKLTSTRTVLWQQQESRTAKKNNMCNRLVGATAHIV